MTEYLNSSSENNNNEQPKRPEYTDINEFRDAYLTWIEDLRKKISYTNSYEKKLYIEFPDDLKYFRHDIKENTDIQPQELKAIIITTPDTIRNGYLNSENIRKFYESVVGKEEINRENVIDNMVGYAKRQINNTLKTEPKLVAKVDE